MTRTPIDQWLARVAHAGARHARGGVLVLVAASGLSLMLWLQFGLVAQLARHTPNADSIDFSIDSLRATRFNRAGKKHQINATHLAHYPHQNGARLTSPHLIQYELQATAEPRHIYAESGWLDDARATLLLRGNVRIIETAQSATHETTTDELLIHLN